MGYNKKLIAAKLLRWEKFLNSFRLPRWEEMPSIGLYMDQAVALINDYLYFFNYDQSDEKLLTGSMVNNYVKMKLLPPPEKRRYGRLHIACLIMICTCKQTLSLAQLKRILPSGDEEAVRRDYAHFIEEHEKLAPYFTRQVKQSAAPIFDESVDTGTEVNDLVMGSAITASFARLMTGKIISLKQPEDDEDGR